MLVNAPWAEFLLASLLWPCYKLALFRPVSLNVYLGAEREGFRGSIPIAKVRAGVIPHNQILHLGEGGRSWVNRSSQFLSAS